MSVISRNSKAFFLVTMLTVPISGALAAQQQETPEGDSSTTVYGERAAEEQAYNDVAEPVDGPDIEGIISARSGDRMQVTAEDGSRSVITINDDTEIKGRGGFLGLGREQHAATALMNGLPVDVETLQSSGGELLASKITFKNDDLDTAAMIHDGTAQQFAQHGAAINKNAKDTEALRGRMGDIGDYNVKGTTNVHFDTGKAELSAKAKNDLCATANAAKGMDNALMLVSGYTDSTGSLEYNQMLSEKRAERVVNYLQQACGWKPYRMLNPTGMAEAEPVASNDTAAGKAQNRRVAVNILVSKGLDGL
ncbi:OmpA family protein [Altericroceibacterium spongiae]|uniref:OmpA family protein n=1 Tax=Altericroceibacterium spongiae TaxID=2320269 RepID=A0A420EIX6_9SPHN|nr:OmpA family protein [Altericroceibacterium spongiae]RKF20617.1 OmpA family protein [Altericroceibacterium spongiae]